MPWILVLFFGSKSSWFGILWVDVSWLEVNIINLGATPLLVSWMWFFSCGLCSSPMLDASFASPFLLLQVLGFFVFSFG